MHYLIKPAAFILHSLVNFLVTVDVEFTFQGRKRGKVGVMYNKQQTQCSQIQFQLGIRSLM
jgi:hypothetical protein